MKKSKSNPSPKSKPAQTSGKNAHAKSAKKDAVSYTPHILAGLVLALVLGGIALYFVLSAPTASYYADINVKDYGTITVYLDGKAAPQTVKNFVSLAKNGFYDGLTFHRIVDGFMIQGGSPDGTSSGRLEETIYGEFSANGYDNPIPHVRGTISMARPNSFNGASCQFFITQADWRSSLDGLYAAFGSVTSGMEIVDQICADAKPIDENGIVAAADQPVITSITIRDAK